MDDSTCTDVAPTFTYSIDTTPINHLHSQLGMYVDPDKK